MPFDVASHCILSRNGRLSPEDSASLPGQVSSALASGKPLLIWFHGGLVSTSDGIDAAKSITKHYESKDVSPLFFIWETGPATAIYDAVVALVRRKLGSGTIDLLSKLLNVKLEFGGGLGAAGSDRFELTAAEEEILLEAASLHPDIQAEAMRLALGGATFSLNGVVEGDVKSPDKELDQKLNGYFQKKKQERAAAEPEFAFDLGGFLLGVVARFVVDVAKAVLARYRSERQHTLKETIIEEALRLVELGTETWTAIKKDAEAAFENDAFAVGRRFVQELGRALQSDPNRRVILVGHSAGAIYICHFLQEWKRAGLTHKLDVRFLAPAARFDLVQSTFESCGQLIGSLRYFALTDRQEREEALLGGAPYIGSISIAKNIYMGSLLYLVAGSLEAEPDCPIFGMQRFIANPPKLSNKERESVADVMEFIRAKDPDGIVWSTPTVLGNPGYVTWSARHGDFDDDPNTRDSVLV